MVNGLLPALQFSFQADSRAVLVKLRRPCLHLHRLGSWANLNLTIRSSRARFAASAKAAKILPSPLPQIGPA